MVIRLRLKPHLIRDELLGTHDEYRRRGRRAVALARRLIAIRDGAIEHEVRALLVRQAHLRDELVILDRGLQRRLSGNRGELLEHPAILVVRTYTESARQLRTEVVI